MALFHQNRSSLQRYQPYTNNASPEKMLILSVKVDVFHFENFFPGIHWEIFFCLVSFEVLYRRGMNSEGNVH